MSILSQLRIFTRDVAHALAVAPRPTVTIAMGPASVTFAGSTAPPLCPCSPGVVAPACLRHGSIAGRPRR